MHKSRKIGFFSPLSALEKPRMTTARPCLHPPLSPPALHGNSSTASSRHSVHSLLGLKNAHYSYLQYRPSANYNRNDIKMLSRRNPQKSADSATQSDDDDALYHRYRGPPTWGHVSSDDDDNSIGGSCKKGQWYHGCQCSFCIKLPLYVVQCHSTLVYRCSCTSKLEQLI